ncbi:MAG TPA: CPBP family intramembrane glutamic endopeptidase [Caldilineaceae bacterium]|nr:CPBP family intramembrane glutamic endopeptidase [Caldilineaceae bacterium]
MEALGLLVLFLPFFAIAAVANLAEKRREQGQAHEGAALLTYILIAGLYALAFIMGVMLQLAGALMAFQPELMEAAAATPGVQIESLPLVGLGLWLPAVLGVAALLPPVRRLLAGFMPIDPQNPVHGAALALSMLVITNLLITLGFGLGNLAEMVAATEGSGAATIAALWLQQALTALLAMVGVGWLIRRDLSGTLARLGIVMPSGRQWLLGVGLGIALVPVVLGIEYLASLVGLGADPDVERLTEELLGSLFTSPLGILTVGLSAALGEETLFRGALLPRFGIIVTSLLFALVHSNYGITISTLVVFLLGLVLAWVRLRHNTTTAMALHAVYNMTLGLLAYLSASLLDF